MMVIGMHESIYAYALIIWICENIMISDKHLWRKFICLCFDFAITVMAVDLL